jgi:hypothetical protein
MFTITNTGSIQTGPLMVSVDGDTDFAKSDDSCVVPLQPTMTCTVTVRFRPTKSGAHSATLTVVDSASGVKQMAGLTGSGITPAQLSIGPADAFPDTPIGQSFSQVYTLINSGEEAIPMLSLLPGGGGSEFMIDKGSCAMGLAGAPLGQQTSCVFTVTFTPMTVGMKRFSVTATASSVNSVMLQIMVNAVLMTTNSFTLAPIGNPMLTAIPLSESASAIYLVTNTSSVPVGKAMATLGGQHAEFTSDDTQCPDMLAPMDSCIIVVTYTPTEVATRLVFLTVNVVGAGSQYVQITGSSTNSTVLQITPLSRDYGTHAVNSTTSQTFTVSNRGTTPIMIQQLMLEGTDAVDFVLTNNTCGVQLDPAPSPNRQCTFVVRFIPQTKGTGFKNADVLLVAAPGGTFKLSLFGQVNR